MTPLDVCDVSSVLSDVTSLFQSQESKCSAPCVSAAVASALHVQDRVGWTAGNDAC